MKTNLIDPRTRAGRIRLHLACIRRGGSAAWHFKGILREISEAMVPHSAHPARS
jgi:hypothetical protein